MKGSVCHELEVDLPAAEIWEVYSRLRLGQLVTELLPHLFEKVEIVEGDGGVGTVLLVTFPAGISPPYKEKFVKIDDEKRVKETLGVEGGFLELGFHFYLVRFEIVEKDADSCIIKSTIEYQIDDERAANASLADTTAVAAIAEAISGYLLMEEKKSGCVANP